MTKSEFKSNFQSILNEFEQEEGDIFTCTAMGMYLNEKARDDYDNFIELFKSETQVNVLSAEKYDDRVVDPWDHTPRFYGIRALLLSNFYEEAIRTKEYLKW